jgi:hypothetical protein
MAGQVAGLSLSLSLSVSLCLSLYLLGGRLFFCPLLSYLALSGWGLANYLKLSRLSGEDRRFIYPH